MARFHRSIPLTAHGEITFSSSSMLNYCEKLLYTFKKLNYILSPGEFSTDCYRQKV